MEYSRRLFANKQFEVTRFYAPRMILNVIVVAAIAQTVIGGLIVAITLNVSTKPRIWNVAIPVGILVYMWTVWSFALAGVWVTEKRIVIVQPLRIRLLSAGSVQHVGLQKRWRGLIAMAYIRWDARTIWIPGISAPQPTYYPAFERRARMTVERLRHLLGLDEVDDDGVA